MDGFRAMIDRGRHNVLGVLINAVDCGTAVERITAAAASRQPLAVSALAVHGVMTGALDPEHRYRLNRFDLLVPDGQPVRWALNLLYRTRLRDRVYGPTLMLKTCERLTDEGLPIFLFGGSPELLDALRESLLKSLPELQIAGLRASKFRRLTQAERDEAVREIRGSGAAVTFVGLGCPRQEVWTYEFREALSMPIVAVGAAFDFHAGRVPQAPRFLQRWGLEWLFRLCVEPRRLWRRYLLLNPLYAGMLLLQFLLLKEYDPQNATMPKEEILYG